MNALNVATAGPNEYLTILEDAWQQHLAPRAIDAPTVISLFAGCGGSSLGYSMAGYRELLAVEWDAHAVETFKLNFPDVPVYHGDIADLSVEACMEQAGIQPGELDVLDGSPPCQGFSTAGKRRITDVRNHLFREYVRLLEGLQPKVLIMENVAGMVKGKMKLLFTDILRGLKACGYHVRACVMNAMYYHVPQRRQRLIFLGARADMLDMPSYPQAMAQPYYICQALEGLAEHPCLSQQHYWVDEQGHTKHYGLVEKARQGQKYRLTYQRERWHAPASTITRNGIGKPYLANSHCHPLYTRTFSLRETARLSSFPDAFKFAGQWEGWDQVGNAVPPLFMRAIAQHVRTMLDAAACHGVA